MSPSCRYFRRKVRQFAANSACVRQVREKNSRRTGGVRRERLFADYTAKISINGLLNFHDWKFKLLIGLYDIEVCPGGNTHTFTVHTKIYPSVLNDVGRARVWSCPCIHYQTRRFIAFLRLTEKRCCTERATSYFIENSRAFRCKYL
jgi:hypothetical protein